MTDEERQRQMDFIVNHQAQITVNLDRLTERMDKAEGRITRVENVLRLAIRAGLRERKETREKIKMLIDAHIRLAEAQALAEARTEESFAKMAAARAEAEARTEESFAKMAAAQAQTDAALAKLAGSQTHTDERLDALIEIVRKERNGNSDSNG